MPGNPRAALHTKAQSPSVTASCTPIVLTDPTKSKRSASCFTTRAKSPHHDFNGHVILLGMRSSSALTSPDDAPRASALITVLHKCASLLSPMPLKMCQPISRPIQCDVPPTPSQNVPHWSLRTLIHSDHADIYPPPPGRGLLAQNPERRGFRPVGHGFWDVFPNFIADLEI